MLLKRTTVLYFVLQAMGLGALAFALLQWPLELEMLPLQRVSTFRRYPHLYCRGVRRRRFTVYGFGTRALPG
jgi:hypothetical protein